MRKGSLTLIDLFAGAGGLSEGLSEAIGETAIRKSLYE